MSLVLGKAGERSAEEFLKRLGYKILERNYRSRFGEIDLIAKEADTIVFVEVKMRTSDQFGTPLESITRKKLSKLIKTSQFYIYNNSVHDFRFDALELVSENGKLTVNHVKNITF